MRLSWLLRPLASDMGNIIIHLLVESHHPPHRAYRHLVAIQQTPDPEAPSVGMALLQVIHLDHQGEPDLAGWRRGGTAFVLQPRKVLRFKTANPPRNGGTRDMQNRTDTAPIPALIVQFDHLEAGLVAVWMAVIGAQGQLPLHRHGALLPELFDRLIIQAGVAFIMDDPGQLAKLEPVIACFEASECF